MMADWMRALDDATVLLLLAVLLLFILLPLVAWFSRVQLRRQQGFVQQHYGRIEAMQRDQFRQAQGQRDAILDALTEQNRLLESIRDRLPPSR